MRGRRHGIRRAVRGGGLRGPLLAVAGALIVAEPASAIVGGRDVPHSAYPGFVSVGCGATLVAPARLATAAHCFWGFAPVGWSVRVGKERRTVTALAIHPRYVAARVAGRQNPEGEAYDVAILELDRPVTSVKPVPLSSRRPRAGERLRVVGRGLSTPPPRGSRLTAAADPPTPELSARAARAAAEPPRGTLRAVDLRVLAAAECQRRWRRIGGPYYPTAFRPAQMVCATAGTARRPRSACLGDSGGPVLQGAPGAWRLAGIVSWGKRCGADGDPTVAASTVAFRRFLRDPRPALAPEPGPEEAVVEGDPRVSGRLTCRQPGWLRPPERMVVRWTDRAREPLSAEPDGSLRVRPGQAGQIVGCEIRAVTRGGAARVTASVRIAR